MNNKISISVFTFFIMLFGNGCSKSYLNVDPQGQIDEGAVLRDPLAANNLVTGVYNSLYQGSFGPTTVGFLYYMTVDVASDDADKGSTPGDFGPAGEMDNFTVTSNNFILDNLWKGYYLGINKANKAIDILNKASFDTSTISRLKGEVSYLRALYYFNLVRLFGGVPEIISVPAIGNYNSDSLVTRVTADAIYAVIVSDLQFAVNNLPPKGDPNTEVGRANRAAAEGLLAKVYMYQKNWQKVADLTNDIITSGQYSLVKDKGDTLSDYNVIFREKAANNVGGNNNTESIFEVQTGVNIDENAVSPLFSNGQGPRGKGGWNDLGFGLNDPSADLASTYEGGDTRKTGTIIFIQPTANAGGPGNTGTILWDGFRIPTQDSVENQRYNYKGYVSPIAESAQISGNKDNKPKNIRIMRYAEVLLMNAEAAINLGNAANTARTDVNMIRNRAGLPSLAAVTINDVWKERRLELAMEQDRFFDLVRTGRAATVLGPLGFKANKNEVFPIPQAEIDLSGGKLKQNPGY